MLKKALLYLLFAILALVLTAGVALFLVLRLALAPGRDEWPARVQIGPVGVDVGVPTAIRLATSSWFGPWLDGHQFDTEHGPVVLGWNEPSGTLEIRCAPCSATLAALGDAPLRLDSLRATVRRDAGTLSGVIEATPASRAALPAGSSDDGILRGRWDGRLSQTALHLDITVPDAPITRWYAMLAPAMPELQRARIGGTLALDAQVALPAGTYALAPRISDFTVEGLGTEAMVGARSTCGAPSRLTTESWLARTVVAAEDPRFFANPGYDLGELTAALGLNPKATQAERESSTLTEQLARLLAPAGGDKTAERLRQMLYAVEMEQTLGKTRILQLYLDNAPWGHGLCGAEAAARAYFKRSARGLDAVQAVWLAVLLQKPDASILRWQHDNSIDAARARSVVEGVRGLTKVQRDALLQNVSAARFAPP